MVGQNLRQADLQLSPADLGPLEVRVVVTHDQANVSFTSNHAHVREALEAAIPRLREMLEQQGLNLANADVSQHSFAEQRAARDDSNGSGSGTGGDGEAVETTEAAASLDGVQHGRGLVDYYA
jgi:flagellar hook-length control protein FliK